MTTTAETTPTEEQHTHEHHEGDGHEHAPKSECEREIAAEIPADLVARETDTIVQKYQKLARIPGFRKGKVPASLIRKQFANEVKQEVIEKLIPQALQSETQKQGLTPISQPRITDLHAHEGEPLRFKAAFEVMPTVEVGDYKNHGIQKPHVEVTDEELNKEIDSIRERQANFDAVDGDRALVDGDYASISFEGIPKPKEGEEAAANANPAKMDDVLVEIGGANTVKEFSDNLRGAKAGDERTFDVAYAEDFSEPKLAGQTITYKVKVNGIKKKSVPELNDEFAKELGDFENFEDFKTKFRENMLAQKQQGAESETKDKLIEHLISQTNFPVPEAFVEQQIDLRLSRGLQALAQQGMRDMDMRKLDVGRLRAGQREGAVREVKAALILDKIADQENIEVTDEELDNEIRHLATHTGEDLAALETRLRKDGSMERIRDRMRNEKTLNQLLA